jgi:hypothetical protein
VLGGGACRVGRKQFFFEKKNQKTFVILARSGLTLRARRQKLLLQVGKTALHCGTVTSHLIAIAAAETNYTRCPRGRLNRSTI